MMGHSFGAATALLTLGRDYRLKQVSLKCINTETALLPFLIRMQQHPM
jgi:predicted dienelactone hydrolase